MHIAIFGLGYVGVVTAACFARAGHRVVGVDVAVGKVAGINHGRAPIIEHGVDALIAAAVAAGRLRATVDASDGLADAEIAIVCVGTPSGRDGRLGTEFLQQVLEDIGAVVRARHKPLLIVIRSTVLPGTLRKLVLPLLEKVVGRPAGAGYEVVFNPEFLREGSAVQDFDAPPKIVVGERVPGAGAKVLLEMYRNQQAPRFVTSYETAEMVKYTDNVYHALKVTFANEIGQLSQALGADAREVMEIFRQDTKLNISPAYFQPGFAFGGSCLPKDTRALLYAARQSQVTVPLIGHILASNQAQMDRAVRYVLSSGRRRIGFHGLAFKPGTDDLRESPLVELAEFLLGKGCHLTIFDQHVHYTHLTGGNKAYIDQVLPHLAKLLIGKPAALSACELIIIGHPARSEQITQWLASGIQVYDLVAQECRDDAGYCSVV